jgi:hypothetical protein
MGKKVGWLGLTGSKMKNTMVGMKGNVQERSAAEMARQLVHEELTVPARRYAILFVILLGVLVYLLIRG